VLEIAEPPLWRITESSDSWPVLRLVGEGDGQSKGCDTQKGSKRRNASAKVKRKSAVRRATTKKVKLKVQRASGVARKSMTKRQRARKVAASKPSRKTVNQVVEAPVKDTIIDAIEEPVAGVIDVTEAQTVATADSTPSAA
jgi:hypothetical protein